jgi:type II secretory pathway component PulK
MDKVFNKIIKNYNNRKDKLLTNGLASYLNLDKGYVLSIVLVISTLLISISIDFLLSAQVNNNYMKKFRDEAHAQTIAEAGLSFAHTILKADTRGISIPGISGVNKNKSIDTNNDIWAMDFPEMEIGRGSVKIIITDEQSKLNISAVATKYVEQTPFYSVLERFIINMGFPVDYAEAILDWVDDNDVKIGNGAETYDYYSTLPQPYEAANAPFDSIDQLLLIKHFSPEIFYGFAGGNSEEEAEDETLVDSNNHSSGLDIMGLISGNEESEEQDESEEVEEEIPVGKERSRRLSEYFRAHGNSEVFNANINKININTASYRVLLALSDEITEEQVTNLIKRRNEKPFIKADDAKEFIQDELIRKNIITTNSSLFRIKSIAYVNNNFITIEAVYDRSANEYYYYSVR